MLEQFGGRRTFGGIFLQALGNQLANRFAIVFVLILLLRDRLQCWWLILEGQHQHLHRRKFVVGSGAGDQLDGSDAQAPDVRLEVVAGDLLHHLGRHPAGRSHERVTRLLSRKIATGRQPRAYAEIYTNSIVKHLVFKVQSQLTGNLNGAILAEKNIARLDVAMDLSIGVKVFETFEHFTQDGGDGGLVEDAVFTILVLHLVLDDVEERATAQQLDHQPQFLLHHERGVIGDHVVVVARRHGLYLLQQLVHRGVPFLQVDLLDRALLPSRLAIGRIDVGRRSDAWRLKNDIITKLDTSKHQQALTDNFAHQVVVDIVGPILRLISTLRHFLFLLLFTKLAQ